jgi:hypothetical protein
MAVAFSLKSKANPVGVATYQLYPQGPEEYVARQIGIGSGC